MELFDEITPELREFMAQQPVFFVASAPLDGGGHVNISPKGLDTFRVLGGRQVTYLDLTGSGNETSAHLQENGRITIMFCSFGSSPSILRLYGRGRTVLPGDDEFAGLRSQFPEHSGTRQVIVAEIDRIQTSCGYAVPLMENARARETLTKWAQRKGPDGLASYQQIKNSRSIDGLSTPLGAANGEANGEADGKANGAGSHAH